jgi:hypothetical protein
VQEEQQRLEELKPSTAALESKVFAVGRFKLEAARGEGQKSLSGTVSSNASLKMTSVVGLGRIFRGNLIF